TAVFEQGCLSFTNSKNRFDPPDRDHVIRLDSYDAGFIYQQFLSHVQRRQDQPREFPTLESLRCWFDDHQASRFEERVRRRLFLPMTEKQVAAAMRRLDEPPPLTTTTPPLAVRTPIFWLILIATVVVLSFIH
ncbi:MAG TPA: hypothetical protein VNX46_07080, partial [Candidatus Acidoferrum sp.]|nr:hypothetical protein [Candidatus Acidoferrum sp.]